MSKIKECRHEAISPNGDKYVKCSKCGKDIPKEKWEVLVFEKLEKLGKKWDSKDSFFYIESKIIINLKIYENFMFINLRIVYDR